MTDMSGHNIGGADERALVIQSDLSERHADILERARELLDAGGRVPEVVDDDSSGKVGDFVKMVDACLKNAEAARVKEKEPFLQGGRIVDGWFEKIKRALLAIRDRVDAPNTTYLRKKERDARLERERIAREAEEAARAAQRAADLAAENARGPKTQQKADIAAAAVEPLTINAAVAAKAAAAPAAELSRTRGDLGSVSGLRTFWDFKDFDRPKMTPEDWVKLQPHIKVDAIQKAIRAAIDIGERKLDCCTIFENNKTAYR